MLFTFICFTGVLWPICSTKYFYSFDNQKTYIHPFLLKLAEFEDFYWISCYEQTFLIPASLFLHYILLDVKTKKNYAQPDYLSNRHCEQSTQNIWNSYSIHSPGSQDVPGWQVKLFAVRQSKIC